MTVSSVSNSITIATYHMKHTLTLLFFLFTCALYGTDDEEWQKAIAPYKNRESEVVIDLWNKDFALNQAISGRVRGIFEALDKNLSLLPPNMRRITGHDSLAIPMVAVCLLDLQYLFVELSELHLFSFNNVQALQTLLNELITPFSLSSLDKPIRLDEEKPRRLLDVFKDSCIHSEVGSDLSSLNTLSDLITGYIIKDALGIHSFYYIDKNAYEIITYAICVKLANRFIKDSIPACNGNPLFEKAQLYSLDLAKWVHQFKWKEAQFGSKPLVFCHENYSSYNCLIFLMLKGVDLNQIKDLLVKNGYHGMVGLLLKMGAIPTHQTIIEALNRLLNLQKAKKRGDFVIRQMEKNQAHALRLVIQHVMNALIEQERDAIRRGEVPLLHSGILYFLIRNVDFSDTCALMRLIEDDMNRDVSYYVYLLIWLDTHYLLEDNFTGTPVAYKLINYRKVLEELYFNQDYQSKDLLGQQILSRDFLFDTLNLLPSEEKNQALHQAIMMQNLQQVGFWLQLGANPNTRNPMGNTALWDAVNINNVALAEILLEFGADMQLKHILDLTPFSFTIIEKMREMARCLLRAYVNFKVKSSERGIVSFDEIFNELIEGYDSESAINFIKEIFYEEGWMVRPSHILSIQPVPLLGPSRIAPPINIHRRNSSDTDDESDLEDDDSYSSRLNVDAVSFWK